MKNMKKFTAQQLTKKQMNEVKGGAQVSCDLIVGEDVIDLGKIDSDDPQAVEVRFQEIYGDIGKVECMPWLI